MIDERLIYEWLRPELKEHPWQVCRYQNGGVAAQWVADSMSLPPLDMNTAFAECIPKLLEEGAEVTVLPGRYCDFCCIETWVPRREFYTHIKGMNEAFYTTLTKYLVELSNGVI